MTVRRRQASFMSSRPRWARRTLAAPRARASGVRELPRVYTTRLQKGGAVLAEMRRLLLEWDGTPGCAERILQRNPVSAPSRTRL
jgi:hypothetical protein